VTPCLRGYQHTVHLSMASTPQNHGHLMHWNAPPPQPHTTPGCHPGLLAVLWPTQTSSTPTSPHTAPPYPSPHQRGVPGKQDLGLNSALLLLLLVVEGCMVVQKTRGPHPAPPCLLGEMHLPTGLHWWVGSVDESDNSRVGLCLMI
jgi:hypothetical protein